MLGNRTDHLQHLANSDAVGFQVADDRRCTGNFLIDRGDGVDGGLHDLLTGLGTVVGIIGGACRLGGMAGDLLSRSRHLMHGRGHLVGALELIIGAAGHAAGDIA
ncbi:hypothetical protein D3C79_601020 [compost metagenome]